MARGGRGGKRGGGAGRGGKRGGGDAASSGGLEDSYTESSAAASTQRSGRTADGHANERRALRREDMYDDVDAFMDERHSKVALIGRQGAADDDEDEDFPAPQQARGRKGKAAAAAARANTFELEGLEPDEDEDEDEEEDHVPGYFDVEKAEASVARQKELDAEANISTGWGKHRATFYDSEAKDFEIESDEDVAANEEAEARRLQDEHNQTLAQQVDAIDDIMAQVAEADAQGTATGGEGDAADKKKGKKGKGAERSDAELLKDMDDELDNIDMALELDLDIAALGGATDSASAAKGKKQGKITGGVVSVERITKDLSRLSDSEKLDMLLTSSPELLAMLDDYKAHLAQLENLLPAWEEMKDHPEDVDTALYCFVSMKVNTLLLYLSHMSFYLSLKAGGRGSQLASHPVTKVLLGLRSKIEQLRKMEDHFAALEEEAEMEEEAEEGEDADEQDEEEELAAGEDGEEDEEAEDDGASDDEEGALDGAEDGEDDEDDEEGFGKLDPTDLAGSDLLARQSAQLERLLAGVAAPPKGGKKKSAAALAVDAKTRAALADFGEADHAREMSRAVSGVGKASGKLAALQAKAAAANKLLEAQSAADKNSAAHKALLGAKRKPGAAGLDDGEDDFGVAADEAGGWGGKAKKPKAKSVDDPEAEEQGAALYAEQKAAKAAAKAARAATYAPKTVMPGTANWDALSEEERRAASKAIKANRGLVRSRRKDKKNPKTANRLRYEKAVIARKGQVQLYQGAQDANYGGQATGIKTNVTKSISLRS